MKIAVPVTKENQIDSHFGHCETYGVFTILYLSGLVEDSGSSCHQHEAHHHDGGSHTCSHN
jgi:predicted Fe-Mo cluster-binding NifX family protein